MESVGQTRLNCVGLRDVVAIIPYLFVRVQGIMNMFA
jgi:hypothetical protein